MKRVIGGLLVISLLSQPSTTIFASQLSIEVLAVEQKIYFMHKKSESLKQKIDTVLNLMLDSSWKISSLLRKRNNISKKIQSTLNKKALTKVKMLDNQIESFRVYSENYELKDKELKKILIDINDDKNLNLVQQEILDVNSDYTKILSKLIDLNNSQARAIKILDDMINSGNHVLQVIETENDLRIA